MAWPQLADGRATADLKYRFQWNAPDVAAVAGEVLGQTAHLPRQTPARETEDREHQRDHRKDRRDAAHPTFKPVHKRSQHEREKDGERQRHEHGLRQVQDDHNEDTPGERHPRLQCLRRVIHQGPTVL
jgi:hypothetical protein